ncbi:MAG: EamA family transporter [Spirochaetales bacterium]|nr:EamA family transporter [Spirochaetales bacterium]
MKKETSLVLLSYATIYIVWGSTYFFIKMAVESIPPLTVVGIRFFTGGTFFLLFALIKRKLNPIPTLRQVAASILLGSLLLLGGNGFISFAERKVDSYFVALVLSTTPLIVALFDRILLSKRVTLIRMSGISTGVFGVGLLLYNGQSFRAVLKPEILMVLAAITSWSLGTSLGHRFRVYPDNFVNSGIQMSFAGLVCLIYAAVSSNFFYYPENTFSIRSLTALAYLAVIGSLAFSAYTYLLSHQPASKVVSYALINPIIAVLLGLLIGNETAAPYLFAAMPLILLGLAIMLYGEKLFKFQINGINKKKKS